MSGWPPSVRTTGGPTQPAGTSKETHEREHRRAALHPLHRCGPDRGTVPEGPPERRGVPHGRPVRRHHAGCEPVRRCHRRRDRRPAGQRRGGRAVDRGGADASEPGPRLAQRDRGGLRAAWNALERSWATTYDRAAALPPGSVDVSVDEEWSFAQTLRHLVFVTDAWLGAIRGESRPFHPWGLPFTDLPEFIDRPVTTLGIDPDAAPSYPEVLDLRADRVARVREFLADLTPQRMEEDVEAPVWMNGERLSVHRCLRVIFSEECEHLRFAERDLDVLAVVRSTTPGTPAVVG